MANSSEERGLLINLWKNNQQLLEAILLALSNSNEIDPSARKAIRETVEKIKKDTTKYRVEGYDSPMPKNRAVLAVVEKYVASHPDVTFKNLKIIFNDALAGTCSSFGVVRNWDEIVAKNYADYTKHYFDGDGEKIGLSDGTEVFVLSHWTKDDFKIFSDYSNRKLGIRIDVAAK